jgi:hypothetical protein
MIRILMCLLAVGAVVLTAAPAQGQPKGKEVKLTKQWRGSIADASLMKGSPEVITSTKELEKLWKTWNIEGKAPEVDFKKEIVILGTTSGSRLNLMARLDDNGDLLMLGMGTLDFGEGFRYVIATVSRDGVKTVNKKALPAE